MSYFNKILVANRGEIAVRIIRACRALGIGAVAVYSEADRAAPHVRLADEAYLLGPAPASQSYLSVERIMEAARRSGADALHPGYGFLSERAVLAEACADAGVTFIGPSPQAIEQMGSKIAARTIAARAGTPTVPGYDGDDQSNARLLREAERVGFPLLIKASAGGGGKGMRTVAELAEFEAALAGARREALAAFGDDAVLLERRVMRPRHVEIQVLADRHGSIVYLGERECSIQRRHQKIIEEAPSPVLTPELRARMGQAALRVAAAVEYINAGTMEFLLDESGDFFFLEMNTRLQVEHPVTELVTGLDLVQLQIAVAAGEPLPFTQQQVALRGHAIEARVYAEDPVSFLPSTGTLTTFDPPTGPFIRNDAGVERGSIVGVDYDPMLAKLIVSGPDRASAIATLRDALARYRVEGVTTNLPLLRAIANSPAFLAGDTTTAFLDEHQLDLAPAPPVELLAAAAAYDLGRAGLLGGLALPRSPWECGPWRASGPLPFRYIAHGSEQRVSAERVGGSRWRFATPTGELEADLGPARPDAVVLHTNTLALTVAVEPYAHGLLLRHAGQVVLLETAPPPSEQAGAGGAESGDHNLTAPMPGTVTRLLVKEGQAVELNQPLLVLEAMKMEHTIASPYPGVVAKLLVEGGQLVAAGAALIEIAEA